MLHHLKGINFHEYGSVFLQLTSKLFNIDSDMIDQMTKSQELLERRKNVVANGVGVFNTATVKEAKGAIIVDADGKELFDFAGGIGTTYIGNLVCCGAASVSIQYMKDLNLRRLIFMR